MIIVIERIFRKILYYPLYLTQSRQKQVKSNPFEQKIKLFPNPAKDKITIDINAVTYPTTDVILSTMLGEIIFQSKLNTNITTLDISNYAAGIYFLTCKSGAETAHFKLVKD